MVVGDKVMAHVEVQVGPFGVVSLMSRQAVDDMDLAPRVVMRSHRNPSIWDH